MDQILEFFSGILSTDDWPARWFCGYWTDFHGWLYIISDVIIWFSYFAIPAFLLAFIYRKPNVPLPRVFWLFTIFILACGLTHLMDAVIFWWPAYRLSALIRFITAIVSLATVVALIKFFPKALQLTTSEDYDRELNKRLAAEAELLRANQKLNLKNQEVEQFAYIASHDLQEPLRSMNQVLELANIKADELQDKELKQYLDFIQRSNERMEKLTSGLLDFSKLGLDRKKSVVDLNTIAHEVLEDLSAKIKETNGEVNIANLPTTEVYRTEIRLLIQNLINNALKFHKAETPPIVHINVKELAEKFEFSISDNGIGIKERNKDKIFHIFQRLNPESKFTGSGIGLAHCKKIVEMHNGNIWVESEFGVGSTFYFTISKTQF